MHGIVGEKYLEIIVVEAVVRLAEVAVGVVGRSGYVLHTDDDDRVVAMANDA